MRWGARPAERGQGSVEAAIAVPILLFVVFAFMQVGWTAFAMGDLESGISHMEQSLDDVPEAALSSPEVAAEWVADRVCENSTVIDRSRLEVRDARVSADDRSSASGGVPSGGLEGGFTDAVESASRLHLTCTLVYDNSLLFPIPGGTSLTEITRGVDATENGRQELEVR